MREMREDERGGGGGGGEEEREKETQRKENRDKEPDSASAFPDQCFSPQLGIPLPFDLFLFF